MAVDPLAELGNSLFRTYAVASAVQERHPGSYADLCREARELAERLTDWFEALDEWARLHATVGRGRLNGQANGRAT